MRIIIDAMGGDFAPKAAVFGAIDAQNEFGIDLTFVGDREQIEACLKEKNVSENGESIKIVHTTEIIDMHDDPTLAVRSKKDSSMTVALKLVAAGEGDAAISAGSTGAFLTGATLVIKRIQGIRRAALSPIVPVAGKGVLLIDCGANMDCTPAYLAQFAMMGSRYAEKIMDIKNPRVAQLNIGAEDCKGTDTNIETYAVLQKLSDSGKINFIGNIEAREAVMGGTDVLVTDGYNGNIFLKAVEGTASYLFAALKETFMANTKSKMGALLLKDGMRKLKSKVDTSETGGTVLLGLRKTVVKAHGNSNERAFRSAIKQAIGFVEAGVIDEIKVLAQEMKEQ